MKRNPSLFAQPRHEVSSLITPRKSGSIYGWLEANNRFIQGDEQGSNWSEDDAELLMTPLLEGGDDDDSGGEELMAA